MKKISFWVGLGVILATILILAIAIASSRTNSPSTFSSQDPERPKIFTEKESFNLGEVSLEGSYDHTFLLENKGKKPLELRNFKTSCDCTKAIVKIEGQESPTFGMHNPPAWKGVIEPGKSAELIVTYEPKIHPIEGEVERAVLFQTNDPEKPEMVLSIKAKVKR